MISITFFCFFLSFLKNLFRRIKNTLWFQFKKVDSFLNLTDWFVDFIDYLQSILLICDFRSDFQQNGDNITFRSVARMRFQHSQFSSSFSSFVFSADLHA